MQTTKKLIYAPLAELADAHGSGPCAGNGLGVQVSQGAPKKRLVSASRFFYEINLNVLYAFLCSFAV